MERLELAKFPVGDSVPVLFSSMPLSNDASSFVRIPEVDGIQLDSAENFKPCPSTIDTR
jgi:hypothetical protein